MAVSTIAAVLLDVLSLVKTGMELKSIADKVQQMDALGATDAEISTYLKNLRNERLQKLRDALD